jgi:adenosine kinase
MTFPGRFRDHILPDQLERISLSFLVDEMVRRRGGIAANIAYTLALLGERPLVMATVGEDFAEYRSWLEQHGVDTSGIQVVPGVFTASFFVNTDQAQSQIASFYTGAMACASELSFSRLPEKPELAVISPNDPEAMRLYVEECQELGIPFVYDPSQQIVRLSSEALRAGLEACLALFTNDYELGLILEKTDLALEEILAWATFVVVTKGERGADIYAADRRHEIPIAKPQTLIDPTGVGDAFRGGFLKGYSRGLPLEVCGRMGALSATYCLEHEGTQGHDFDLTSFTRRYRSVFGNHPEIDNLS